MFGERAAAQVLIAVMIIMALMIAMMPHGDLCSSMTSCEKSSNCGCRA